MTLRDWLRPINALFILIPVSIALAVMHASQIVIFAASALAIIPLSSAMGKATEEIAKRIGGQWGGLLNATFGNATEIIIGIFALRAGYIDLTRASIIGSILGNILLVFGACAFAAGLKYKELLFNEEMAQSNSITLLLAVMALTIPAVFVHTFHTSTAQSMGPVEKLSIGVAGLLVVFYIASLVFSLKTHEELFRSCDDDEKEPPAWSLKSALAVLVAASLAVAYESDLLVSTVKGATLALGVNQIFVGIIIVPIIGNAAEHASAITLAMKNKMNLAFNIAIGSSIQIAMFVAPLLMLVSLCFRHYLTVIFPVDELVAVATAVVIAAFIAGDGKTHWLEGAQLLAAYMIVALAFFFLPR